MRRREGGEVFCAMLISLPSEGHPHSAASSSERREPRLDRGGLRLGERVFKELQLLQRRQRSNRVGECHELVGAEVQRLQHRQRSNRVRKCDELVAFEVQLRQTRELDDWFRKRCELVVLEGRQPRPRDAGAA